MVTSDGDEEEAEGVIDMQEEDLDKEEGWGGEKLRGTVEVGKKVPKKEREREEREGEDERERRERGDREKKEREGK